jgi:uncharacterized protein (TIGR00251 family)
VTPPAIAPVSRGDAIYLDVRVQPRASREGFDAAVAGRVRVRVSAPPVDGAANRRVTELVAEAFGVPRSAVVVIAGAKGRDKRLMVTGARRRPGWYAG